VLQILQWTRPRHRWVLKSPQHLEQLGPLLATFPDATVVVTHRDPVSVVQSAATMMTYAARLGYRHPRPEFYVDYWSDRVRRLLDASVRDRDVVPVDRSVDVYFDAFMRDEMATVRRIYDAAGLSLTDEALEQIAAYSDAHPRGLGGHVRYDLRVDFGVSAEEIRRPFGFYFDRFEVPVEVP
jgi:Sulfotransferase family